MPPSDEARSSRAGPSWLRRSRAEASAGQDALAREPGDAPALTWRTKLLYSLGAAASSIKQRPQAVFLLLYYNQVIGVSPGLVSLALTIAVVFDAVCDPLVGQVSDNFRHRWGRRHPFMYAAAIPVSLAFFLIWNPPQGWSETALFAYLLTCLFLIRLFDTFFELPSLALLPELTRDYQERTFLLMMRSMFGALGGLGAVLAAYQVFMKENPDGTGGVLDRAGYLPFSVVFSLIIFGIILTSAAGTHDRIPYLRAPPGRRPTPAAMAREMAATLNNHAFVVLVLAGVLFSTTLGVRSGLDIYFSLYFWELTQGQLAALAIIVLIAYLMGAPLAVVLSRRFGKKRAVQMTFAAFTAVIVAPIALRLVDLMPANGTDLLFVVLSADIFVKDVLGTASMVLMSAMMADVVEDAEVKTGRRSEGLLLSAENLFRKMVSAVGVLAAGVILTAVDFPRKAERGQVDPDVLWSLGFATIPVVLTLLAGAFFFLSLYRIDEARHNENLRILREREA